MSRPEFDFRFLKPAPTFRKEAFGFRCAPARSAPGSRGSDTCEDAIPVLREIAGGRVLLAVADGLGGYSQGFDDRSGGQIASETAMQAALDLFAQAGPDGLPDAESLTNSIFKRLRHLAETRLPPSRLRGALGRHKLATTLALAVVSVRSPDSESRIRYYWIGDSRIYFLDSEGLHQLTHDDSLTGMDAFKSIFEPAPMSQFLAASMEREWRIHARELSVDRPGVVFACTDGCYGEWRSPWAFEAALQRALDESDSWADWLERYRAKLEPILSDDASLVAFPVGLPDFRAFQQLRGRKDSALARSLGAERKKALSPEKIWASIYQEVYERKPGIEFHPSGEGVVRPVLDICPAEAGRTEYDSIRNGSVPAATIEQAQADGKSRFRARGPSLGLAWLLGFFCGLPLGGKVMAWMEFFWRWFKSLWQST